MKSARIPLFLSLASLVSLALVPATAAAQELRFTATAPGGIVGTGNTLGLSKGLNENGPGIRDSIGTFISLDPASVDDNPANAANPWPAYTTFDWTKNGSSASLKLPEAEILYAELLWGGSFLYSPEDVSGDLDTPVTIKSGNTTMQVSPDPLTALTIMKAANGFQANYYMRSAEVTDFVKQIGSATYEVLGVPATQTTTINSLNAAGWTLVVAYRDEGESTKNLSIFVGGSFVDENTVQDYSVSGFCAPPAGDVTGTVVVSTIEGDANLTGDQLLIGPGAAGPFEKLSGPNNPENNFFCSQLNDAMGNLDTSGSFGMANHDAANGVNVSGARQGWDVTTVPLSSVKKQLQNSQKAATIRTITTGDSFAPILAAFAIDVNAPDFTGASSAIAAPDQVGLNEMFEVTATLENGGQVAAQGITLTLPIDGALSVISVTSDGVAGDINGNAVDAAALAAGVDEGDLPAGQTRTVKLTLEVAKAPQVPSFFMKSKWSYGFEVCANEPLVPGSYSRSKSIAYSGQTTSNAATGAGGGSASNGVGGGVGVGGDATASNGAGGDKGAGGSGSGTGGGVGDEGSCSCSTPGHASGGEAAALGLLGLAALFTRTLRRRR